MIQEILSYQAAKVWHEGLSASGGQGLPPAAPILRGLILLLPGPVLHHF